MNPSTQSHIQESEPLVAWRLKFSCYYFPFWECALWNEVPSRLFVLCNLLDQPSHSLLWLFCGICLGLPNNFFFQIFAPKIWLCFSSHPYVPHLRPISLSVVCYEYNPWSSSLAIFSHSSVTSFLLGPCVFLSSLSLTEWSHVHWQIFIYILGSSNPSKTSVSIYQQPTVFFNSAVRISSFPSTQKKNLNIRSKNIPLYPSEDHLGACWKYWSLRKI